MRQLVPERCMASSRFRNATIVGPVEGAAASRSRSARVFETGIDFCLILKVKSDHFMI
jgi:hypothetical protein